MPLIRWHHHLLLAVALVLGACGAEEPLPPDVNPPGFGGSGGTGVDPACDRDGDGEIATSCAGLDCNDRNPDIHTGAAEVCDGATDENCDGTVDEGCECVPGEARRCYPLGESDPTRNVGACADGLQRCTLDGTWGSCEGAVEPSAEGGDCDGIDQACDGVADGAVRNACGVCGETPEEVCGNGLDDDCDGTIDDPDRCNVRCDGLDAGDPQPAALTCCIETFDGSASASTPARTTWLCDEWPGLPGCAERPCLDLDGDPATICVSRCIDLNSDGVNDRCACGRPSGGGEPLPDAGCGFESACALQDCAGRVDQPCYSGPPSTLGVGLCRGGVASCVDAAEGREWSVCEGEVLPAAEICGNGLDDDCDGEIDEADGATGARCPGVPCRPDAVERCGNGVDDDCDGVPDDGCLADAEEQSCYGGPLGTRGVGICADGVQRAVDGRWGACEGEVLPRPEVCGDGIDSDCNGLGAAGAEDPGCCIPTGEEVCNGVDDDCDGLVDEGVVNACGRCDDTCFTTVFRDLADCGVEGRTCERVARDALDPGAITLSRVRPPEQPWIHLAGNAGAPTFQQAIVRVDTRDATVAWTFAHDRGQTRAVRGAPDGSVWIVAGDVSVLHVDANGGLLCETAIPEMTNGGAAVDGLGRLYVVSWSNFVRFYRVNATEREPGVGGGPPRCVIDDLSPEEATTPASPVAPAGAQVAATEIAVGDDGVVWAGSRPLVRWENGVAQMVNGAPNSNTQLSIDAEGAVWFVSGNELWRAPSDGVGGAQLALSLAGGQVRPGTAYAARDGSIWLTMSSLQPMNKPHGLLRFQPETGARQEFALPPAVVTFSNPSDLGEDAFGRMWTFYDGALWVLDPSTGAWTNHPISGTSVVTTGPLTTVGMPAVSSGTWRQVIDAGFHDTQWTRIHLEGAVPEASLLETRVRFSSTHEGLESAPVCGPFVETSIDLASCGAHGRRFAEVELRMRAGQRGDRPSIRNLAVEWSRP